MPYCKRLYIQKDCWLHLLEVSDLPVICLDEWLQIGRVGLQLHGKLCAWLQWCYPLAPISAAERLRPCRIHQKTCNDRLVFALQTQWKADCCCQYKFRCQGSLQFCYLAGLLNCWHKDSAGQIFWLYYIELCFDRVNCSAIHSAEQGRQGMHLSFMRLIAVFAASCRWCVMRDST